MELGDTFRFAAGDTHTWIVLSDPKKDKDRVLLVNVTSWRADKDQSCLLNPGDHPAIQHNSCIQYADARMYANVLLDSLYNANRIFLGDKLSNGCLRLVLEGAAMSKFLKRDFEQLLIDQGLIEA